MNRPWIPRDPVSAYTHLAGVFLAFIGTIVISFLAFQGTNIDLFRAISSVVFGVSLIALYAASTIYHWYHGPDEKRKMLRKLDHSMIYVLIAGSYTPILAAYLPLPRSVLFVSAIWATAAVGILIKLCWFSAPRMLSTFLYVAMGWAIIFDMSAVRSMPLPALVLLVLGGVSYTVGGIIYAIKKPCLTKNFGFHELFHVFVMLGSLFHFFVVAGYVI